MARTPASPAGHRPAARPTAVTGCGAAGPAVPTPRDAALDPDRARFEAALAPARRSRSPRPLEPLEQDQWRSALGDVRPLDRVNRMAPHLPRQPLPVPGTVGPVHPAPRPADAIAPLDATLDRSWERKVRTGELLPDLIVDLHGHAREPAYQLLVRMLHKAHARHARLLLVITGKGKTGAGSWPAPADGVLRAALPGWLETPQLRPFIAALRPAHPRHGGAGAGYVILRRQAR